LRLQAKLPPSSASLTCIHTHSHTHTPTSLPRFIDARTHGPLEIIPVPPQSLRA
jgi:hypothetical protein